MIPLANAACLTLRLRACDGIECVSGALWITASGDARDAFIGAGERVATRGGVVVIEALQDSHLVIRRPPRAPWMHDWQPRVAAWRDYLKASRDSQPGTTERAPG